MSQPPETCIDCPAQRAGEIFAAGAQHLVDAQERKAEERLQARLAEAERAIAGVQATHEANARAIADSRQRLDKLTEEVAMLQQQGRVERNQRHRKPA